MKFLCSLSIAASIWAVMLAAHPEVADAFRQVLDAPAQIEEALIRAY